MIRTAIVTLFVGILAVLLATDGRASLYHPDDHTWVVPVDEQGAPVPYPFEEFQRRRLILRNIGNPDWPLAKIDPKTGRPQLTERGIVDARIKKALAKKAETRTEMESVALAVDLLDFGRPDDAEGALRSLRTGFLPNVTLAHIAAAQGQWGRAYEFLFDANDEKSPAALEAKSPHQLAWQRKLDRGAFKTLLKLRTSESREKQPPETELPDQLWPVQFVNAAGQYEPGALAPAEKAKLPGGDFPEAIATVQQLVLWFPADVRLYWLLGELYAAKGDVSAALKVMNECAWSDRYSNRKVLMEHREIVKKAIKVEPPEQPLQLPPLQLPAPHSPPPPPLRDLETQPPPPLPFTMGAVWIYIGAVAAVALFALVRTLMRWTKGG